MKRTAHSVNRGFTTVKRDFTSVERGFSSVKMTFTSVKHRFTSVERRNLKYAIPDPVYLGNPLYREQASGIVAHKRAAGADWNGPDKRGATDTQLQRNKCG